MRVFGNAGEAHCKAQCPACGVYTLSVTCHYDQACCLVANTNAAYNSDPSVEQVTFKGGKFQIVQGDLVISRVEWCHKRSRSQGRVGFEYYM